MTRPILKSSLSATNNLARTANLKLHKEASLPEYRLRFLVCHANMLDAVTLSLFEIQQRQIEYKTNLEAEEKMDKSSSAAADTYEDSHDSAIDAAEPSQSLKAMTMSVVENPAEQQEISLKKPACTSEIISQIGYELERTISRCTNENAAVETGGISDSIVFQDQSTPRPQVAFKNPIVVRLC